MFRGHGRQFLLGLIITFGLAAHVDQGMASDALPPGFLYEGSVLNVRSPNADGWVLTHTDSSGMQFGKQGDTRRETFGAQVAFFPIEPVESEEAFLAFVRQAAAEDTDPSRFTPIETSYTLSPARSYTCVRSHTLVEDKKPAGRRVKGPELLEMYGLYCRHPDQPEYGFAAIYSRRGVGRYPALEAEADEFISGVTVP